LYLPLALTALGVYLPLVVWVALCIGLKVRSQIKAVIVAASVIGIWLMMPALLRQIRDTMTGTVAVTVLNYLIALNPSELIPEIETIGAMVPTYRTRRTGPPTVPWLTIAANLLLHGTVLFYLRRWCLDNADRLLGRLGEPELPTPSSGKWK
jgi:hypothetical protein